MSSVSIRRAPSPVAALFWKEFIGLAPLVLALVIGAAFLHAVLALIPGGAAGVPALLILLPNLFALGTPPWLVGQEAETGTLRRLRDLPVRWGAVFGVKGAMAGLGLATVWGAAFLFDAMHGWLVGFASGPSFQVFSIGSIGGADWAVAFSVFLMTSGFAVAWWVRSPIASLLLMVPVTGGLFASVLSVVNLVAPHGTEATGLQASLLAGLALGLAMVSGAGARRTLVQPWERRRRLRNAHDGAVSGLPLAHVPLTPPGRRFALLWQIGRQTAPLLVPLTLVGFVAALLSVVLHWWAGESGAVFAISVAVLATSGLGAAVFITDNDQQRYRFLADRGIAPWTVWWTRQLLPLAMSILVAAPAVVRASIVGSLVDLSLLALLFAGAFVSGQLSGQLFRRPVVGLFAAPVMLWGLAMIVVLTLFLYPTFVWNAWLAAAVLWGVTLRLTRRWLEGRKDWGYYGRLLGWIGMSLAIFLGAIAVVRYATTPPRDPAWRAVTETSATAAPPADGHPRSVKLIPKAGSLPRQFAAPDLRTVIDQVLSEPDTWLADSGGWSALPDMTQVTKDLRAAARRAMENSPDSVDAHSREQRTAIPDPVTLYADWLEAIIRSSRRLYQEAFDPWVVSHAERMETLVLDELARDDVAAILGAESRAELGGLVPAAEERNAWRRAWLLRTWLAYQRNAEFNPFFAYGNVGRMRRMIPAERWRTSNLIDRAVRISLEQLEAGLPPVGSPGEAKRLAAWRELLNDEQPDIARHQTSGMREALPTIHWTPARDARAARLRREAAREGQLTTTAFPGAERRCRRAGRGGSPLREG